MAGGCDVVMDLVGPMCAHVDLGDGDGCLAESSAQELDMEELIVGDLGGDPLRSAATGFTLILGDR